MDGMEWIENKREEQQLPSPKRPSDVMRHNASWGNCIRTVPIAAATTNNSQWIIVFIVLISMANTNTISARVMHLTQRNNHANISELLDNLLRGYDNSIRPGFGGAPVVIEVDIMVRSMGPISEVDMTYSMDCYFRQSWVDRRLAFTGGQDTLALSISMLARIWKPDTYFYNGKQSYLHTITTPNKFVRLYQDGRVLYSSRLTIKAGCPMNLADFPMDIQRCPLKFGSFGYTTSDVIYKWNGARSAVAIAEDMKLSQFDLVDCPAANLTDTVVHNSIDDGESGNNSGGESGAHTINGYTNSSGGGNRRNAMQGKHAGTVYSSEYSMLLVNFHLQRHMGNFLIQVYGPCVLLVVLSWVSFWLNREATADRVSLGITTVLTMTFLGLEARTDLPKVPYPTALDFFVFLSFAFIFATIIQFAIVHYFTKYGSGECYFSREDFESDSDSDLDVNGQRSIAGLNQRAAGLSTGSNTLPRSNVEREIFEVIPLSMGTISMRTMTAPAMTRSHRRSYSTWLGWPCRRQRKVSMHAMPSQTSRDRICSHTYASNIVDDDYSDSEMGRNGVRRESNRGAARINITKHRRSRTRRTPRFNSVSKIDRASRIFFPLVFLLINLFYWLLYTHAYAYLPSTNTSNGIKRGCIHI